MAGSWREVIEAGNTEVQPCWSVHWCPHKHRPVLKKKAHVQEWLAQKCHCGAQELGDPWGQCEKLLTSPQYHVNMLQPPAAQAGWDWTSLGLDQKHFAFPSLRAVTKRCQSPGGLVSWNEGGARWRWGAAAQLQHSLHSGAPWTHWLGPSSILSADITSGSLQGDVAKGYTQGVKQNIFSGLNQEWVVVVPLALRHVHSHTRLYVHAEFI